MRTERMKRSRECTIYIAIIIFIIMLVRQNGGTAISKNICNHAMKLVTSSVGSFMLRTNFLSYLNKDPIRS